MSKPICPECKYALKQIYERKGSEGKIEAIDNSWYCNNCKHILTNGELKIPGSIPSLSSVKEKLKMESLIKPDLYGNLYKRITGRDVNYFRLFWQFVEQKF